MDFENTINDILQMTNKNVLRELDIKRVFGNDITAIDHLINNEDFILCIQDKWCIAKPTSPQVIHFIKNVNDISIIMNKPCIGLYLSKMPLSHPSLNAINRANVQNKNYFLSIYDISQDNIYNLLKQFLYNYNIWLYDDDGSINMLS
jgi:hypothetical protein